MAEKLIRQQPVTMAQVVNVVFMQVGPNLDVVTSYRPVDETGTPIGETRGFTEHVVGPDAVRIRDFLAAEILPNINEHEHT